MEKPQYTVLVIDDEMEERGDIYLDFFEKDYIEEDFTFKTIMIKEVSEFNNLCNRWGHVDAIFLDANLDKPWNSNYNYYGVLLKIESMFAKRSTPPVFMVSKHWVEEPELLMNVSMNISRLRNFDHPSAYYDFSNIVGIVSGANEFLYDFDKEKADSSLQSLLEQRCFIRDEIIKHQAMERVDAVIILAVPDEKEATYEVFEINSDDKKLDDGLPYQVISFEGKRIAFVTQKNMGPSEAARSTEKAISVFAPRVIIMGGVCAGDQSSLTLGTILVPQQIWDYASGKISTDDDGNPKFERRLECVNYHSSLTAFYQEIQNGRNTRNDITDIQNSFSGSIPESDKQKTIKVNPMASGPWVVDSRKTFELIKSMIPHEKFCAIDMEAYSVASVSNMHNIPWVIVKTVQDYANGNKSNDESGARKYATFSSAKFIKKHLKRIIELS